MVLTSRGDILYANARFAALVGEPLESVVGSRVERFVSRSDRAEFEALLGAGSGRRRSRLIGVRFGRLRGEPVAHHHGVAARDHLNLIVTDLSELLAGEKPPRARRARQPNEGRVPGDAVPRAPHSARRDQQRRAGARADARRRGARRVARARSSHARSATSRT